jgi:hypothetical protein
MVKHYKETVSIEIVTIYSIAIITRFLAIMALSYRKGR